jgi:DNA invertase Pin-like site-specific DNA recombinase
MKAAIYARVSTKDQGQDPLNQVAQLREYSERQGWEVAAEYIDLCSGKTPNREKFKAMFEAAYSREFDVVLFWSLDRFSREGVLETLQQLREDGQSYQDIADELGRSRSDIHRVCQTLNCSPASSEPVMLS